MRMQKRRTRRLLSCSFLTFACQGRIHYPQGMVVMEWRRLQVSLCHYPALTCRSSQLISKQTLTIHPPQTRRLRDSAHSVLNTWSVLNVKYFSTHHRECSLIPPTESQSLSLMCFKKKKQTWLFPQLLGKSSQGSWEAWDCIERFSF